MTQHFIYRLAYKHFKCMSFYLFVNEQREQHFRKSFIISQCTATKFSRTTLWSFIVVLQKLEFKLIRTKFLLPIVSRTKLSIKLSTLLWNIQLTATLFVCGCQTGPTKQKIRQTWNVHLHFWNVQDKYLVNIYRGYLNINFVEAFY